MTECRTHLMDREQVDDEGVLHASEGIDLRLDDCDGLLLEDGSLGQDLHLRCIVRLCIPTECHGLI